MCIDINKNDIVTMKQFDEKSNKNILLVGSVKTSLENNKIKVMLFDKKYGRNFGLFTCPIVVGVSRILSINGKGLRGCRWRVLEDV